LTGPGIWHGNSCSEEYRKPDSQFKNKVLEQGSAKMKCLFKVVQWKALLPTYRVLVGVYLWIRIPH
jgi:hypothetical protein